MMLKALRPDDCLPARIVSFVILISKLTTSWSRKKKKDKQVNKDKQRSYHDYRLFGIVKTILTLLGSSYYDINSVGQVTSKM